MIKSYLEGLGHTVTYIDDNEDEATTEAAAAAADLVYISESVSSGGIREEITEIETPMIITEAWAWDEMGLTSGGGGGTEVASTDITIVKPDHFLAAGLNGTVPVLTGIGEVEIARFGNGIAGLGATVIATATLSDGQTYDVLFIYEKGAPLAALPADGSPAIAADTRICMFFDERSIPLLNDNAYELLAAAVNYALGMTLQARNPNLPDDAEDVSPSQLQWSAGHTAKWHNVYFGQSPTLGLGELVSKRQAETSYEFGVALTPYVTYYWRVDEVEADGTTIHAGPVWSFTTAQLAASGPSPLDGAVYVDPSAGLSWLAGYSAETHDVYLGTDEADVAGATAASPEFRGRQPGTTYAPESLAKGTTYYWRIDEVEADGATIYTGDVWTFSTLPDIPIRDPNLIGWWKLDYEGIDVVTDYSGHDHHGTLVGDLQWVTGVDGDALAFDGASYVDLPAGLIGTDIGSVCVWIKTTQAERGMIFYGSEGSSGDGFGGQNEFHVNMRDSGLVRFFLEGGDAADINVRTEAVNDDAWHHIAATWDIDGDMTLYVDGGSPVSGAHNGNAFELIGAIRLGAPISNQRYYVGLMDDVRLYDYVLSPEEIAEAMQGDPVLASGPSPANQSIVDIERAKPLSWLPGDAAAEHHVYLGADRDAVAVADTSDTSGLYRGRQDLGNESYDPPEALEFDQTYYWRVDELNADGTVSTGKVWSFTVANYLVVDDFESYDDADNRIYEIWVDGAVNGTGSYVGYEVSENGTFGETLIVHGGNQSMPMSYDNSASPFNSETERSWAVAQDWTRHGVDTLTLFVKGHPVGFSESSPGTITLSAAGADIWEVADEFRYAHKRLNGDGAIVARMDSIANTDPWAKGGVMIRNTLDPGSRFAAVYITPGNGCRFQARKVTIGLAVSDSNPTDVTTPEQLAIQAPYWVKLERSGDEFNGYYSDDPATGWTAMAWNPQTITMTGSVYIGLALTSHSPDNVCIAEFSGVSTSGNVSGAWEVTEIGVDHPDNSPDDLYVALGDGSGHVGVVVNSNPDAVLAADWTQWDIPLSDFATAGVNVTTVKTMSIGVGDRNATTPDGTGLLYIDDIRLSRPGPSE